MISVRVLRLVTIDTPLLLRLYNLSVPSYCCWLGGVLQLELYSQPELLIIIPALYCAEPLSMRLWQVSLAVNSGSLIGCLPVTFGGTPNYDVSDSLDGAYLGPFNVISSRTVWLRVFPYQYGSAAHHQDLLAAIGITSVLLNPRV